MKDNFPDTIKVTARLPWGYLRDENNPSIAIAQKEELEALSKIFDLIDGGESIRQCVENLKGQGYEISKTGLITLWNKYRPDSPIKEKRLLQEKERKKRVAKQQFKKLPEAEQAAKKARMAIAAEKRRITAAQKRIANLAGVQTQLESKIEDYKEILTEKVLSTEVNREELQETERPVLFEPNPGPQTDFLAATELEVLFGGAAGGGKSYALISDPMRYFEEPNFVGLVLRRTNDELRELVWNTKKLYPEIFKGAVFKEKASEWQFPSGARFWMSYLDRDDDVLRYQGQAFTWIGFDELTQYPTSLPWDYLRSRLRTSDPKLKKMLSMRATTNPGGPGHGWVKRMFVDPAPPGQAFWARDLESNEVLVDPETGEPLFKRRFIPSKLTDNPYLADDNMYRMNLLSMSEQHRKQLLDGDWSIADGAAFPEFRTNTHVIEPFDIPNEWTRFRAADYGYSSFSCVLWFAINPSSGQLVVYRELYDSKLTGEALADKVLLNERDERISYGILDSSVWHKRGEGPSIAEVMLNKGCRWKPSDRSAGSRVAGKNRLHELLKIDEFSEEPGIVFFNTCRQVISDLQVIPTNPDGSDDIDPRYKSDHSYDALRYGIMSRPKATNWWDTQGSYKSIGVPDRVFGY